MGKKNNVLVGYFSDPQRFADIYNGYYYGGRQEIRPELLEDASEKYDAPLAGKDEKGARSEPIERIRDIKKLYRGQVLRILAMEDMEHIDYTVGVRNMEYDVMEYRRQIERIRGLHRLRKDYTTEAERLCGFCKQDRLLPVHTLWLYHGERPYDGPRSLKDMLDEGEGGERTWISEQTGLCEAADYPVHLLCVDELLDTEVFHTQVKQLFQVIQKRHDGKALKELFETGHDFAELEPDTVQAIATVLERPGIWKNRERYLSREEGGKLNMCKGMDEWEAQAKSEGRAEGRSEGAELKCIEQTLKKLAKGKSPEEIADALEEELTTIEKICKAIEACGSECTAEKIRTQLVQM